MIQISRGALVHSMRFVSALSTHVSIVDVAPTQVHIGGANEGRTLYAACYADALVMAPISVTLDAAACAAWASAVLDDARDMREEVLVVQTPDGVLVIDPDGPQHAFNAVTPGYTHDPRTAEHLGDGRALGVPFDRVYARPDQLSQVLGEVSSVCGPEAEVYLTAIDMDGERYGLRVAFDFGPLGPTIARVNVAGCVPDRAPPAERVDVTNYQPTIEGTPCAE